ncbi:MAG TPA: hypothetical protein VEA77_06885 [Hyphomicrobium sp.]|nr:hypothetical protein [Hyphomicrobium sp.]
MHLIQILLPVHDDDGEAFSAHHYERLVHELTERFGGVTSYMRAPAEGRWSQGGETEHDEIVVVEVMITELDRAWWAALRDRLAEDFKQDEIVIRSQSMERL